MPYSIALKLKPINDKHAPRNSGQVLNKGINDLITIEDKSAGADAHSIQARRGYTISPLLSLAKSSSLRILRIAWINDDIGEQMFTYFSKLAKSGTVFEVGQACFEAAGLFEDEEGLARTQIKSLTELCQNAPLLNVLCMRFFSPTTFNQGYSVPLPIPYEVFKHYLRRFTDVVDNLSGELLLELKSACPDLFYNSRHNEQAREILLRVFQENIAISKISGLRTERVYFKKRDKFENTGFTGTVTFKIVQSKKLAIEIIKQINILADFAYFCGTGSKTTMGMGQTMRI